MELLDIELKPVLTQLLTLPPRNDKHPAVQKLYNVLIDPERSVEEFKYIVGTLKDSVDTGYSSNSFYVAKTGLEALAFRSPVLEGPWERVLGCLLSVFHDCKGRSRYGPGSIRLNDWIIRVVGDSDLCPSSDLRIQVLALYQKMLNINKGNRKRALESLMKACSSLVRNGTFDIIMTDDLIDYMMEFTDDNYLQKYSLSVVKKIRQNRKNKSLGTTEPWEVQSLTALLKYISDGATLALIEVQQDQDYEFNWRFFEHACIGLLEIVRHFKAALQEPELLAVTAKSIMDVIESVVMVTWAMSQDGDQYQEFYRGSLKYIDTFLGLLCDEVDGARSVDETKTGLEIIRQSKDRICKIRSVIDKEFVDDYFTGHINYFDEDDEDKLLHISNILYNNHY